ncbi:uncharacterized protein LOC119070492 [Bradysia coprophila]|uniref:uncharacterized protein LOC119070492 n=1 Tax=Bradysia coprophila TaxID=38358 RepID=UPI00187DC9F9|nr:uncharacterized protein LOC119070492 [Bradysia coprophila]
MILWRLKTMWLYIMTTAIALLMCNCDGFGKVCKCINQSGTKGNEWGSLAIASNESRLNGYECALIYIRGAPGEIVELRFYDINLRKGCQDEFQIFPHLKESMISDTAIPEEVICAENAGQFVTTNTSLQSDSVDATVTNNIVEKSDVDHTYEDNQSAGHKSFNGNEVVAVERRKTLFSSDNIFGLRLDFKHALDFPNTYFSISGSYRFVDKGRTQLSRLSFRQFILRRID